MANKFQATYICIVIRNTCFQLAGILFFCNILPSYYKVCDIRTKILSWERKARRTLKERAEQTASRGGLLKHFARVQGNFGEELASGGREDKIKHVWYFWASEANSSLCAAIVRIKLSSVNQACDKILGILAWLQWLKIALEEETRRHWWHMRMPAQLDSHEGRTQWGICLASPKLSNMFGFISTFLHFHFTSFTENHRNVCKMASNELQPGANAQCPPKLMRAHRFELSTEAFYFYGSAEVLRKSCISTEQRRLILRKS